MVKCRPLFMWWKSFITSFVLVVFSTGSFAHLSAQEIKVLKPEEVASEQIYDLHNRLIRGENKENIKKEFNKLVDYWDKRGISSTYLAAQWNTTRLIFVNLVIEHYMAGLYYTDGLKDEGLSETHTAFLNQLEFEPRVLLHFERKTKIFEAYSRKMDALLEHERIILNIEKIASRRNLFNYLDMDDPDLEKIKNWQNEDLIWARNKALEVGIPLKYLLQKEEVLLTHLGYLSERELKTNTNTMIGVCALPLLPISLYVGTAYLGLSEASAVTMMALPFALAGTKGVASFFIHSAFNKEYFSSKNFYSDLITNLTQSIPFAVMAPLFGGSISGLVHSEHIIAKNTGKALFYTLLGLGTIHGGNQVIAGGAELKNGNEEAGTVYITHGVLDLSAIYMIFAFSNIRPDKGFYPTQSTKPFSPQPPRNPYEFDPESWMKDYTPPGSASFSQGGSGISNQQTITPTQTQNLSTTQVHQIIRFAQPQLKPTTTMPLMVNPFMGFARENYSHPLLSPLPSREWKIKESKTIIGRERNSDEDDTELREIVRKEGGKIIWRRFIRVKKGLTNEEILQKHGFELGLTSLDQFVGETHLDSNNSSPTQQSGHDTPPSNFNGATGANFDTPRYREKIHGIALLVTNGQYTEAARELQKQFKADQANYSAFYVEVFM